MNKIGKWCLSVLLAVTMAMPVWAAQPADQVVYTQISASETDNVGQTEETDGLSTGETGTEETGDFRPGIKETESSGDHVSSGYGICEMYRFSVDGGMEESEQLHSGWLLSI